MRRLVLMLLSVIFTPDILGLRSQEVVEILSNDGRMLERSLFFKQSKIGEYNKNGKLVRLSADYLYRQKIFLSQSNSLKDHGIILRYPEIIYKDACIIADIISSYDQNEILSFSTVDGNNRRISIQHINKYFTYLDARVDYVFDLTIYVKDSLITQYSYNYKPDMTDKATKYTCVFTYDNNDRIVKIKKIYSKHSEEKKVIYKAQNHTPKKEEIRIESKENEYNPYEERR